jgi:hypothetical protein
MRGSQKVPGLLWHRLFGAPWVRTAWTVCYCSFICPDLQRLRDAFRREWLSKWEGQRILHHDNAPSHASLVTQQFLAKIKHCCHHPTTVPFGTNSESLLAVRYSENGLQGGTFRNHGGHRIECCGRTPEDPKRSLPLSIPAMAGSREKMFMCVCVCVCVCVYYFEDD